MSRSERLLKLIHLLRSYRYPAPGYQLAETLGISLRTLYRDIASLQQQGASIEGEPGLGYVLKPGFMLPPLMFTEEELEALVLGSRWVASRTDSELSDSARSALVKIASVLPKDLKNSLDENTLLIGPSKQPATAEPAEFSQIRQAIRTEQKITIHYLDLQEQESTRTIWPFALGYFDNLRVLVGWCELRQAFRHFRTDRILQFEMCAEHYPRRRRHLLSEWRTAEGIT
ncbi:helix-turn-helix transcriptional regulator [Amphritea pacifica]|uniref:YafY family transcriptional regulator n=1 Tax=Amphritea pacifica TaxID=2811233 RepID=A0ABS2WAP8_9GAMM|nr:YafY family transcriptional regulator [Amphritea pacifica]MBN1005426.1 YafY family transcriptional regulator [Amphritea pacifica]